MSDDQQQPSTETPPQPDAQAPAVQQQIPGADKKILAGILGIVLGCFGVHKFILGYQLEGIILAIIGGVCFVGNLIPFIQCITIFGFMGTFFVGLIEGIIYLTKSDQEFVDTYITNKKPWF